jgi:hypothetical protein
MRRSLPLAVLLALHAWGGGAGRAAQVADEEPAKVHVPDSAFDFLRPLRRASGGPLPRGTSVLFEGGEGGDAPASLPAPSRPGVCDLVVKRGEHGAQGERPEARHARTVREQAAGPHRPLPDRLVACRDRQASLAGLRARWQEPRPPAATPRPGR